MAMSPMAMMTPMAMVMMSVSGPVLSVGTPLMFSPKDVVRPVSLRVSPSSLALVHLGAFNGVVMVMVVMVALGMYHVMSVISNDKDHLSVGEELIEMFPM